MYVDCGELNKRIEIVKRELTPNPRGFEGTTEETIIHSCWAKFTRKSIKQIIESETELESMDARFLIRFTKKEIKHGYYVKYNNEYYHIEYANDYGDSHEYIEIMTKVGLMDNG